jgi:hypothetical protein
MLKLTDKDVRAIRERYAAGGVTQAVLASEFGVDQRHVSKLVRGQETTGAHHAVLGLRQAGMKHCPDCNETKPLSEFPRSKGSRSGFCTYCKPCNAARCRARHAANPEPYRRQASAWASDPANHERVLATRRKARSTRRARVQDAFVEAIDPRVVFERDKGVCGICGDPVGEAYDVDHVVPLAEGGEHSYRNVRLAHPSCNRRRGRELALGRERR